MRRMLMLTGGLALMALVPAAVDAASGIFGGSVDRQSSRWRTTATTISGTAWHRVPKLALVRCTVNQVTASVSVTVRGAPVQFRVVIDAVPEAPMLPGPARFVPDGTESFSYDFVRRTAPFEADDSHAVNVQWRSPTGAPVTLKRGLLNLIYARGSQGC